MCGICGTTSSSGPESVAAMSAAMVHRGPDDEGVYLDGAAGVTLGARRLSVIDVDGGHQPLSNEDRTVWAVHNGEIYNFASLRERLSTTGHHFATRTDTEVLVHLYEEYGDALVHALEGMFAFAVWDARQRRLLLGRDRFGEKPLFYLERSGDLVFASELTALLAGRMPPELSEAAMDEYFVHGYVAGERTVFEGVRQLEPGHALSWEADSRRTTLTRYWEPLAPASRTGTPLQELVGETRRLLEESIRTRLVADVPVGVFLSGGVDSTLVAALASRQASEPIKTFSVGYDVGAADETRAARRVASLLGTEHHEFVLTQPEVAARVPRMLGDLDQPVADSAFVALRAVSEFARPHVTVAVGGEGADEVFGGYPRYWWLARAERIPAMVPRETAAGLAAAVARVSRIRRARRLHDVLAPGTSLDRHVAWVSARRAGARERFYGPRLRPLARGIGFRRSLDEALAGTNGDAAGGLMRLDLTHWLPHNVLAKADRATMRASLEFRTPFLKRELVEFAATVPARVHVAAGGKHLLRRVLREVLPQGPHARRKIAFLPPYAEWLRGPLAPALSEQLRTSALYSEGWFDRDAVAEAFREHSAQEVDRSDVLWPLLALGCWLDTFTGSGRG